MMTVAGMLLGLMSPVAIAADCSMDERLGIVSATGGHVTVDGAVTDVRGRAQRRAFERRLRECDRDLAADQYDDWRRDRRLVGLTAVAGILMPVAWIGTGAYAIKAGRDRDRMLSALRAGR